MRNTLMVLALLCSSSVFAADDGAKVAAKYNCLACHSVDQKIVGPAYKDVAKRYKGQKDAETMLMAEVRKGLPGGKWGNIPMPAQQIDDKDLRVIIRWVLAQ
ncbi:c-type cytochrome [Chitinibacter bivalviorum]|uniref:C-type cytochrome n=1 Tax=Chitinibacter bivalviorum TaxID=2739434 RepID=A0A7H9BKJ5_9NEIS|nr:c-type cytochrome [Chitinibacter bivalviorum]QLG89093.1 c-type cytochrome [Chitinibacter bivalviorum]